MNPNLCVREAPLGDTNHHFLTSIGYRRTNKGKEGDVLTHHRHWAILRRFHDTPFSLVNMRCELYSSKD